MMRILFLLIFCTLVSCASNKSKSLDTSNLSMLETDDYVDHLADAGRNYLNYEDVKTVKLREDSVNFLTMIYDRLASNNQVLLSHIDKPTFYFIKHKSPFIFSLPKGQFFFSTALVERYLKSEALFIAALAAEVLKSSRFIYEKKVLIPLGFLNTEKMISLTRLKPETRYQINEWVYFILKRSGYDSSAYLNWIQVQNRNTLDFSLFLGDSLGISKEEHLFKNFMTKQGITSVEKRISESNSSKEFYKLINNVVSKE